MKSFWTALKAIFSQYLGNESWLFKQLGKIRAKIDKLFEVVWGTRSFLERIKFLLGSLFTLFSMALNLFFVYNSLDTLVDVVQSGIDGQDVWLDKLALTFTDYPSFMDVIATMDTEMTALQNFFSPPPTFTYILKVTGIGHALNSILACAVQGVAFVINMQILKWSLSRINLTMIKPIK